MQFLVICTGVSPCQGGLLSFIQLANMMHFISVCVCGTLVLKQVSAAYVETLSDRYVQIIFIYSNLCPFNSFCITFCIFLTINYC